VNIISRARNCLLLPVALLLSSLTAQAERLAFVIGNKDYAVGALRNPVNDANAIASALRSLGFSVTLAKNLKRDDIGVAIDAFVARVRPGDDVVFFYAGHGVQVKGINYLPAIDAVIRSETDVPLNSINLNQLVERLDEARAGVRLFLVDACRHNPYSRGFRSNARGLARMEASPFGTLMHFATRPGGVASDGQGANGLYTKHLLMNLSTPGVPVESMLKRVASGVRQESGGGQQPWAEGSLDGEFFFTGSGSATATRPSTSPEVPVIVEPPAAALVTPSNQRPNSLPLSDAYATALQTFNGVVFSLDRGRLTVDRVPAGVKATLRPNDIVLGCQRNDSTNTWEYKPIVSFDLLKGCKKETSNGRSYYVFRINRDGEEIFRSVVASDN
jgi:Caspase domain